MGKMKTKEELLSSFKKANKERREVLANRAGFDTPEQYQDHLLNAIVADTKKKKKVTIHNVHVLDVSSSMGRLSSKGSKCYNAYHGIGSELEELSKDTVNDYNNHLTIFDDKVKDFYINLSCRQALEAPLLLFDQGLTALNDAICHVVGKFVEVARKNPDDRILIKIFTDGGENCSKATFDMAKQAIKGAEELGITVTFVGTQYDTDHAVKNYGLFTSNTLVHDNTSSGVAAAFNMTTNSTRSYATKVAAGATKDELLQGFYKQEGTL